MVEELLDHVDDCRGSGRRHALLGTPGIDFRDQLGLDRGCAADTAWARLLLLRTAFVALDLLPAFEVVVAVAGGERLRVAKGCVSTPADATYRNLVTHPWSASTIG